MNFAIFWYHSLFLLFTLYNFYLLYFVFFFAFLLWILLSHFLLPRAYHDHVWSTWSTWGILRRRGREKEERKRLCSNIFLQINQMCNLLFLYLSIFFSLFVHFISVSCLTRLSLSSVHMYILMLITISIDW